MMNFRRPLGAPPVEPPSPSERARDHVANALQILTLRRGTGLTTQEALAVERRLRAALTTLDGAR